MDFIDVKYINFLSSRLEKFSRKKDNLYNFRCPICGDSQKNKTKCRGYLYQIKNNTNYKCHNCGVNISFNNFLKKIDTSLHKQYIFEKFKQGKSGRNFTAETPELRFEKPKFPKSKINLPIASKNEKASQYLKKRKVNPVNFFYAEKFKEFCNSIKKNTFKDCRNDHPRIIIPLYDFDESLIGFQGRSLDSWIKPKYLTVMLNEEAPKIYGLNTINKELPIYVVEGPFDSTFIDNSVALCGSDGSVCCLEGSDLIFVYDNEPRNQEIVRRIGDTIDRGNKVVIWPKSINEKDINDMILSGHNVMNVLKSSTYSGLQAKVKFNNWKKI